MLNVDLVGCASFCPHALKGQKLLAQGIALGNYGRPLSPCKGKSFKTCDCLSSNDSAKKVQTRTELSLLKLCRVQPFFETALQRYGNFLILPNFTLQSYVKRI